MKSPPRKSVDRLGAKLAGILEETATDAALLAGVPDDHLRATVDRFEHDLQRSMALVARMRAALARS